MYNTSIVVDYTASGHIVGMLDRDQRTAKLRCDYSFQHSAMLLVLQSHSQYYYVHPCHRKFSCERAARRPSPKQRGAHATRTRNNNYLWNTLRRLKQALIAGIYLLSLVSVPYSVSAPTSQRDMASRKESIGSWVNPCSLNSGPVHEMTADNITDMDLLSSIVMQARIALDKADKFKEEFAQKSFNIDSKQLHENWKGSRYDWLPTGSIHKGLNETVSDDYLSSLKMDDALVDTYHYLQMIAVGLEQMVWDQEDTKGPFLQSFNESERFLRLVLCEMQTAIYEHSIHDQMKPDVTRDIMPDYLREGNDNNSTARNVRDWIIYREYINALEYVIQVFDYLKSKL